MVYIRTMKTYSCLYLEEEDSAHDRVHSMQSNMIRFINVLWQVCGFLWR